MRIRDEYRISHRGKEMVLYAGLLDAVHAQGLKSIETHLVQIPSDENGQVAIVRARVTMDDETHFEGIGDASSDNVGKNIAPHIIRMAETRAKARAMRDAINVSEALQDDHADAPETNEKGPPELRQAGLGGKVRAVEDGAEKVTKEQLETALRLGEALDYSNTALENAYERWLGYTKQDMEAAISKLEDHLAEKAARG